MAQTIACGACQADVPIDDDAIGRCVTCPVCGWMLAVVAPVAVPPPAAPPIAVVPAAPPASVPRAVPALSHYPARLRARFLAEPWPQVLRGLAMSRWATVATVPLSLVYLAALGVVLLGRRDVAWIALWVAGACSVGLVLLWLPHLIGQVMAGVMPGAAGARVARSCELALASVIALAVFVPAGMFVLAAIALAAMMAVSFGVWIGALTHLGDQLDDPRLATAAARYLSRYVSGMVVTVVLTGYFVLTVADATVPVVCQLASSAIGLLLTISYLRLVQVAETAVSERAPVSVPDAPASTSDTDEDS